MNEAYDRLERIEKLLIELIQRVERLEKLLGLKSEEARIALEITAAFTIPLEKAARMITRALAAINNLRLHRADDPISRAIVEALAVHGPLTLRGLEREVRRIRGKASRSILRAKIRSLEKLGIVRVEEKGRRLYISLAVEGSNSLSEDSNQVTGSSIRDNPGIHRAENKTITMEDEDYEEV